jgi:endoglucanase
VFKTRKSMILTGFIASVAVLLGAGWYYYDWRHPKNGYGTNPFVGAKLAVDPTSPSAQYASAHPDASWAQVLAGTPQAHWVASRGDTDHLQDYLTAVDKQHAVALLALYRIPGRDCGGQSAAGPDALKPDQYKAWIQRIIVLLGHRQAIIMLEPDAVSARCFNADRADLLRLSAAQLSGAGYAVYLDGGNAQFLDPTDMANRLVDSGVGQTRGFFVNQAVFDTTAESITYGDAVSQALARQRYDLHYVIDTSRNGRGSPTDRISPKWWCNPLGVGLGQKPSALNAKWTDAVLWIKRPGISDGACRPGEPSAGQFFPDYAKMLVANAASA